MPRTQFIDSKTNALKVGRFIIPFIVALLCSANSYMQYSLHPFKIWIWHVIVPVAITIAATALTAISFSKSDRARHLARIGHILGIVFLIASLVAIGYFGNTLTDERTRADRYSAAVKQNQELVKSTTETSSSDRQRYFECVELIPRKYRSDDRILTRCGAAPAMESAVMKIKTDATETLQGLGNVEEKSSLAFLIFSAGEGASYILFIVLAIEAGISVKKRRRAAAPAFKGSQYLDAGD